MRAKRLVVLLMLVVIACRGQSSTPAPRICKPEVQDLLIDASAFPEGWSASSPDLPADHHGATRRCGRGFYVYNGVAVEEIYEYDTADNASREFKRQLDVWFTERPNDTPWGVPPLPSPISTVADDFYLACSIQGKVSMCRALGRYGVVIMRFNTHMSPEFMTYSDLETVLRAIGDNTRRNWPAPEK